MEEPIGGRDGRARGRETAATSVPELPDEPAERVRALVERVVARDRARRASVDVEETDEEIRVHVNGDDVGLLIGKHGVDDRRAAAPRDPRAPT